MTFLDWFLALVLIAIFRLVAVVTLCPGFRPGLLTRVAIPSPSSQYTCVSSYRSERPGHPALDSGLFTPWTPHYLPGGFVIGDLHARKSLAGETLFSVTVSVPLSDDNLPSERRTVEDPSGKVLITVYWN